MRFRANIDNVVTFQRVLQCVEKLQKRCIIKFTETEMHIICNQESEDGVQVWSQIHKDALFTDYKIQSNAANVISLGLAPDALIQALRSASPSSSSSASSSSSSHNTGNPDLSGIGGAAYYANIGASEVIMRLAKKRGQAVLALEIIFEGGSGMAGTGGGRVVVSHDVLIDVLKPAEMERIREPMCPEPDIHILLPSLTKLRTVTEHMRQLQLNSSSSSSTTTNSSAFTGGARSSAGDAVLTIHATREQPRSKKRRMKQDEENNAETAVETGSLRLSVETDDVVAETVWTKCAIPSMGEAAAAAESRSQNETLRSQSVQGQGQGRAGGRIRRERGSDDTQEDEDEDGEDDGDEDYEDNEGEEDGSDFDIDNPRAKTKKNQKGRQRHKSKPISNEGGRNGNANANNEGEKPYGVRLSLRAFLKFLSCHVVSSTTIACICEHHCMILYVYIGDGAEAGGVLTFYIPSKLSGSEY